MSKNNRVRRKRCDCFGRAGERPHVCDECGRKFVYCTSFLKHVKTHHDGGGLDDNADDYGRFHPANGGGLLANGRPDAHYDGSRAAADGPDASDTLTSTTTTDRAGAPPSRVVAAAAPPSRVVAAAATVDPGGADGCFHGDSGPVDARSEVIVISSDSSDAEDTCGDPPRADDSSSRNASGRYDVPLLSDISDASDGDDNDDHAGGQDVQQTVPLDLSSSARCNPCAVCSRCYTASSAAVYRCIICPNAPYRRAVATISKIQFDKS